MIALAGCVQSGIAPEINAAAARVLDRLGITLVLPDAGCCGGLRFHLNRQAEGLDDMRRVIDAWWPHVEAGAEAIVMTASGCGVTVKEYAHYLAHDPRYAEKAKRISALTRDIAEIIDAERERLLPPTGGAARKVAFHAPCTLQHGQQIRGVVERILRAAGVELTAVADAHLCCGSAGTYSILQPEFAKRLRAQKLASLQAGGPERIVTANIGCLTHLAAGTPVPVAHWINLLDEILPAT